MRQGPIRLRLPDVDLAQFRPMASPAIRLVRADGVSTLRGLAYALRDRRGHDCRRQDRHGRYSPMARAPRPGWTLPQLWSRDSALFAVVGFPAILAAVPLRGHLLRNGLFGWGSALIVGAIAGLAIPLMLGQRLWLDGRLYGAVYLWMQYAIYRARYPAAFDV